MKKVVEYAEKAYNANSSDAKVKEFYEQVKQELERGSVEPTKEEVKGEEPLKRDDEPTIVEETKSYACAPSTNATMASSQGITPQTLKDMPPVEKAKLI